MGCGASEEKPKEPDEPKVPPRVNSRLSEDEQKMIQESWQRMNTSNTERAFFGALKEYECQQKLTEHTKARGCQFWSKLAEAVRIGLLPAQDSKEEYKKMKEEFKQLGKKHVDYDIQEFYYGQYYRALVQVLELSADEEKAWRSLFTWFSKVCVEAHRKEARKRKRKKEEAESQERLKQQLVTNDSDLPTEAQRVMITHQLNPIEKRKKFDEEYFTFLFEKEPSLKENFKKKDDGSPNTEGCKVKECVLKSVALQADLEKLMEYLEPIGLVHAKNGVPDKHYHAAWLAFMEMIPKVYRSKDLYPELQLAWKSSFNLYTTCMLPDDDAGKPPDTVGAGPEGGGAPAAATAEAPPAVEEVATIEAD